MVGTRFFSVVIIVIQLLFSVVCSNRTRGNGQKLEGRNFHKNTRKNYFTVRETREQASWRGCGVSFFGGV